VTRHAIEPRSDPHEQAKLEFAATVRASIAGELAKDLAKVPNHELDAHLAAIGPPAG
jgi:hypothetical protein